MLAMHGPDLAATEWRAQMVVYRQANWIATKCNAIPRAVSGAGRPRVASEQVWGSGAPCCQDWTSIFHCPTPLSYNAIDATVTNSLIPNKLGNHIHAESISPFAPVFTPALPTRSFIV